MSVSQSLNLTETYPCLVTQQVLYLTGSGLIFVHTACGHRMAHRKWKETKLQPGTAVPGNMLGCSLVSFHFLWAILCPQGVGAHKLHIYLRAIALKNCFFRCQDQRNCHLAWDFNSIYGDPCGGTNKCLKVKFACVPGTC